MRRLIIAFVLVLLIGACVAYFQYRDRVQAEAAETRSGQEFPDANKKLDDTLKLPRGM